MVLLPGSKVRVKGHATFGHFHGGEEGRILETNADARNHLVALGMPPRQVTIATRLLEVIEAASETPSSTSVSCSLAVWRPQAAEAGECADTAATPSDELVCRFCLDTAGDEPLRQACGCRGSSQWVHRSCLQKWQMAVLLGSGGNRMDGSHEDRHRRCAVCQQEFEPDLQCNAADILLSMAGLQDSSRLVPGSLIRYAAHYPQPELSDEHAYLLVLFEAKKEHFRHSVYLLTNHTSVDSGEFEDAIVLGVNLTRPVASRWGPSEPLAVLSGGSVTDEDLARWRASGLKVSIGIGGPVKTRTLGPSVLVSGSLPGGYVIGTFENMLQQGLELAAAEESAEQAPELRLFLGHARWTMRQLLGEIARGSWATVPGQATLSDVRSDRGRLWRQLEEEDRLQWAPPNPLSSEWQSRAGQSGA